MALVAVLVASAAACGYPDFKFAGETSAGGSGGTSSSSTSTVSTGGTGGATSSSGTGGAECRILHPGGGTCEYQPGFECGCEAGLKCSVDNLANGHTKCIPLTTATPDYNKCFSDGACAAGSWCDPDKGVCKPICGTCADGGVCMPALYQGGTKIIPGLQVCTAHCDPESASPCGPGVTCAYNTLTSELDCYVSKNVNEGQPCDAQADCKAGFVCVGSAGNEVCKQWCHPIDSNFPGGGCPIQEPYCDPVNIDVTYNGEQYGVCNPP